MRLLLTLDDIEKALKKLPGWRREGTELVKTYRFADYMSGIDFVNLLVKPAEEMNHHPDLHIGWRKVMVRLTTHSEGGITSLDVELALQAESLNKKIGTAAESKPDAEA